MREINHTTGKMQKLLMTICTVGIFFAGFAIPVISYAQIGELENVVNRVTSQSTLSQDVSAPSINCGQRAGAGACRLAALLVYAVQRGRTIIAIFAVLIIVIAGFRLIISQSDEALTTARRTVLATVIGLFLLFISERFVDALYGGFTEVAGGRFDDPATLEPAIINTSLESGAQILGLELLGILVWLETIVAIVAIGLLVVQAVSVLGSFGTEDTIRKAYRAVFYTVMGLLLVVFDRVIASVFGFNNIGVRPGPTSASLFIVELFGFVRFILFLIGVIIIGVIVYAGLMMLLNFGNDEYITKGKSFLINAGLGLLLIVVSFVIVSTMILGIT